MASINRMLITGRIGDKVAINQTKAGEDYVRFTLVETKINGYHTYHNVVVFARYYVSKFKPKGNSVAEIEAGDEVFVEGRLDVRLVDEDGRNKAIYEVVVNNGGIIEKKADL